MSVAFTEITTLPLIAEAGAGGVPFSDQHDAPFPLTGLNVWSGAWINGIQAIYGEVKSDGTMAEQVEGPLFGDSSGAVVQTFIPIDTTDETESDPIGDFGGTPHTIPAPLGSMAVGIHGRAGSFIDRLSLIYATPVLGPSP